MTYYICMIDTEGFDWGVFMTDDYDYAYRVFEDMSPMPNCRMELRATKEDIASHLHYEVLRYDNSQC